MAQSAHQIVMQIFGHILRWTWIVGDIISFAIGWTAMHLLEQRSLISIRSSLDIQLSWIRSDVAVENFSPCLANLPIVCMYCIIPLNYQNYKYASHLNTKFAQLLTTRNVWKYQLGYVPRVQYMRPMRSFKARNFTTVLRVLVAILSVTIIL